MKQKISMITLGVKDFQKSFQFYNDGLKFKAHNYKDGDNFAVFEMEGSWLSIYPKDKLAEDITIEDNGKGFGGFTLAHNVKSKEIVDTVFQEVIKAGGKPIKIPQEVFWGGYSAYFADPDNYYWEIAYNPFTDLS